MSDAIKKFHDYLAKSPSVVYPEDVLAYLSAIEDENAKLRELVRDYHRFADAMCAERDCDGCSQRDEGACERGVLTSRECVLGVAE